MRFEFIIMLLIIIRVCIFYGNEYMIFGGFDLKYFVNFILSYLCEIWSLWWLSFYKSYICFKWLMGLIFFSEYFIFIFKFNCFI